MPHLRGSVRTACLVNSYFLALYVCTVQDHAALGGIYLICMTLYIHDTIVVGGFVFILG